MNIEILAEPIEVRQAVLSFSGWPDAGKIVEHSLEELKKTVPCRPAAVWDLEGFWNAEELRPQIAVQHGQIQRFEWPSYLFELGTHPTSGPILFGTGPEPTCGWRAFSRELLLQLKAWGCRELYLVGSVFDQIFHDEILISSIVQDTRAFNLLLELGCQQIDYFGPAAIHSAIMESARKEEISCLSIWTHLPFYLNGPHELIMARCLEILGKLLDIELDLGYLAERWKEREQMIQDLLEENQELRQTVESMKRETPSRRILSPSSSKVVRLDEFLKKRHGSPPDVE